MLARSPRLVLERLTFSGPHGTARASATLAVHGDPERAAGTGLAQRLEFEGKARLPQGLLRAMVAAGVRSEAVAAEDDRLELPPADEAARVETATRRRLRTFQQAGFIETDGDDYVTRVRLADGVLTLNGRPLPLPGTVPSTAPQ